MATLDTNNIRKRLLSLSGELSRVWQGLARVMDVSTLLRLLLSLALALGLWVYVMVRNNPERTEIVRARPIEVRGLAQDEVLMTQLPLVDVTIAGPASLVEQPDRPVTAYVELSSVDVGPKQAVPIQVALPAGVRLVARSPEEVVVDIEPLVAREFQVVAQVATVLPAGVRADQPLLEPSTITVTGARSTVAEIARVVVRPDLTGNQGDRTLQARPVPLDSAGREVVGPRLEVNPPTVKVTLPAQTVTGNKTVPIRPVIIGQPAPGYQVDSIQTTPSVINISGEATALEQISALETETISIADRRQALVQQARLNIPPGIVAEQQTVQVEVGISPLETRIRLTLVTVVRGLGAGLRARVVPGSVTVTLQGPAPLIRALDVGSLRAEVNVQGLGVGTHLIRPEIVGPGLEGLRVTERQPEGVTVEIATDPALTPSTPATPAATPTSPAKPSPR